MFQHVLSMFWNSSVSFLNTSGNLLGTSGQIWFKTNRHPGLIWDGSGSSSNNWESFATFGNPSSLSQLSLLAVQLSLLAVQLSLLVYSFLFLPYIFLFLPYSFLFLPYRILFLPYSFLFLPYSFLCLLVSPPSVLIVVNVLYSSTVTTTKVRWG